MLDNQSVVSMKAGYSTKWQAATFFKTIPKLLPKTPGRVAAAELIPQMFHMTKVARQDALQDSELSVAD